MREEKIAPSILSADFTRLGEDVAEVLRGGAEYIHVDVMDGIFVPNISIGVPVVESLRGAFPDAFLDVHLMITQPGRYVEAFCNAGASLLTFHVEADTPANITRALADTRERGVKTCLSVKPNTCWQALEPWLAELDMVLVMAVEPGFGGLKFKASQKEKVDAIRQRQDERNPACELQVDGGISEQTAPIALAAGANVLVAGSAVFGKADRAAAMQVLRHR